MGKNCVEISKGKLDNSHFQVKIFTDILSTDPRT